MLQVQNTGLSPIAFGPLITHKFYCKFVVSSKFTKIFLKKINKIIKIKLIRRLFYFVTYEHNWNFVLVIALEKVGEL